MLPTRPGRNLYRCLRTPNPDQPAPPEDEVVEDAGLFDHERTIEAKGLATDLTMR